jgi:hypothetical protein
VGKKKSTVIGYRYYMGLHMGLCLAIDALLGIKVGGKTAWTGNVTSSQIASETTQTTGTGRNIKTTTVLTGGIRIAQPDLFGGDDKEGGIDGTLDLMMGERTQPVNARLARMLGGLVPAFRGVVTMFFDGLICSLSPYPKKWDFRAQRRLAGWDGDPWYPEKAQIDLVDEDGNTIHAMNPAHIVYECLTNRDWGRKFGRDLLGDAVWRAAADQLYSERFGMCVKWARSSSLEEFVAGVLSHIGAALGVDRTTGLLDLKLIRDDYDVDTLPLFTPDTGLLEITDDSSGSQPAATNEVVVKYVKPVDNSEGQVRVQNLASIRQIGVAQQVIEYPGIPTDDLARRVAWRELRSRSGFLKRKKVYLDRRGRALCPGSVFRISDPAQGIENMVLRAGRVEDGQLTDGKITVTAVQDVFGLPATVYGKSQSGSSRPSRTPEAIALRRVMEVCYRDLALHLAAADLDAIDATAGYLQALAVRPTTMSLDYKMLARVGSADYAERCTGYFCPSGLLVASMPVGSAPVYVTLAGAIDLDRVDLGSAAIVDGEIVRVGAVDAVAGQVLLARGCSDTVPAEHAAGARIWFYDENFSADQTEYTTGQTADAKLLTHTTNGTLDAALAGVDSLTFTQRQFRPYPPSAVQINGAAYPSSITGTLTVSWAHRNRITQADQLIDASVGSVTPESGTTYRVRLFGETGTLQRTVTGLTTTSYSWDTEVVDCGLTAVGSSLMARDWSDGSTAGQTLYGLSSPAQSVVGGRLRLTSSAGADVKIRFDSGPTVANFEATWTAYPRIATSGDIGLVYRTTYWGNANDSFGYICGIHTTSIFIARGGNSATTSFTLIASAAISLVDGSAHSIRLQVFGPLHRVWLDGELVLTVTDATNTTSGMFGVRHYSYAAGYGEVDDLKISELNGRLNSRVQIQLDSSRDGLYSAQAHNWTITRS